MNIINSSYIQNYAEKEERDDKEWGSGLHSVMRVNKPWGYELIWARTPLYGAKIIHINATHQVSLQYHISKDETICVWSGKVLLSVENESGEMISIDLLPGQSYRIIPNRKHRVFAIEDSDFLEATSAHFDDIVRLRDDYGRNQSNG